MSNSRFWFVITAMLVVLHLFLTGCTDNNKVSIGIEYFPDVSKPDTDFRFYSVQITNQIFETLISLGEDYYTIQPNLATEWHMSDDGLVYSFHLRQNVTFHDGQRFTAADVKHAFDSYLTERTTWMLADKVETVTVVDSTTIQFRLLEPYSQFLYMLCSPYVFIVMKREDTRGAGKIPSGTGPFYLADTLDHKKIVLQKNNNYWRKGNSLERVEFVVYQSDTELRKALISSEVDILYLVSGSEIDRLRWKGKIDYYVQKSNATSFFGFNLNRVPFNDIRVRRAVLHALNLPKLVHNMNRGNAHVARGPLPPIYKMAAANVQGEYDPEKAMQLLQQAGYPHGIKVRCNFPRGALSRLTIVEAVKSDLAKAGIIIDPMLLESWPEHTDSLFSPNAQMFFDGARGLFIGEPEYFLRSLYHSEAKYNFFRYNNDRVDSLLDLARIESDQSKRMATYESIVRHIIDDTPAIFYSHVIPHFAYNRLKIKKFVADPNRIIKFNHLKIEE